MCNILSQDHVRRQWQSLWPILLGIYLPASIVLIALTMQEEIPFADLTRDVVSVTGVSVLVGLLSEFGKLMWAAAATICFFTALVLRDDPARRGWFWFFVGFGLLTAFLLMDDILLLHSRILANRVNRYAGKVLIGGYV